MQRYECFAYLHTFLHHRRIFERIRRVRSTVRPKTLISVINWSLIRRVKPDRVVTRIKMYRCTSVPLTNESNTSLSSRPWVDQQSSVPCLIIAFGKLGKTAKIFPGKQINFLVICTWETWPPSGYNFQETMFTVLPIFGKYLPGNNVYCFAHLWEIFALELETLFTALPTFGKYLKHCLLLCPPLGNIWNIVYWFAHQLEIFAGKQFFLLCPPLGNIRFEIEMFSDLPTTEEYDLKIMFSREIHDIHTLFIALRLLTTNTTIIKATNINTTTI